MEVLGMECLAQVAEIRKQDAAMLVGEKQESHELL